MSTAVVASDACRLEVAKQVSSHVVTVNWQREFARDQNGPKKVVFSSPCGSRLHSSLTLFFKGICWFPSADSHLYSVTKEQNEFLFLWELEKTWCQWVQPLRALFLSHFSLPTVTFIFYYYQTGKKIYFLANVVLSHWSTSAYSKYLYILGMFRLGPYKSYLHGCFWLLFSGSASVFFFLPALSLEGTNFLKP